MPMSKAFQELVARYPVLQLIGNTPLVRICCLFHQKLPGVEIYGKAEFLNPGGSIKDRPVLRMIGEATLSGELTYDMTILDSTSGNAGIAYAMIGGIMGYKVELVVPGNASEERKKRIAAHGARLIFTDPVLGYDEALREVRRRYERDPGKYFWCNQYKNPYNWQAHYDTTAEEILAQTDGQVTHFVAGIGTGGTITGIGKRLKEYNPNIEVACIMPEEFPGIEGLKPMSGPEDIVPEILDESVIDYKIPVTIEEAYEMCTLLAKRGLFVGQSSGAYVKGALEVARRVKKGKIVTILCDTGERYFSTRLWD